MRKSRWLAVDAGAQRAAAPVRRATCPLPVEDQRDVDRVTSA